MPSPPDVSPGAWAASNRRVPTGVPSPDAVYPVPVVLSVIRDAGAFGSRGCTPDATCAVTVAATSVWISSTIPVLVVAGDASREYPQEISWICRVLGVAICNMVLMLVPVVTFAVAAVVAMGALKILYRCISTGPSGLGRTGRCRPGCGSPGEADRSSPFPAPRPRA